MLISFSVDNLTPALTNFWFYSNILLASANYAFNVQMVDFISWFSNFKLFSHDFVTGTQLFGGGGNSRFPMLCSTAPYCRPARFFLHNPPFFSTSSAADISIRLLKRSSVDQYLTSNQIFSPLDISTHPQGGSQTQAGRVFSQMICCLGRCAHFKGVNALSKETQVIE